MYQTKFIHLLGCVRNAEKMQMPPLSYASQVGSLFYQTEKNLRFLCPHICHNYNYNHLRCLVLQTVNYDQQKKCDKFLTRSPKEIFQS